MAHFRHNSSSTLVRAPKITANHNRTLVRARGIAINHNRTLVRTRGIAINHNRTLVRARGIGWYQDQANAGSNPGSLCHRRVGPGGRAGKENENS